MAFFLDVEDVTYMRAEEFDYLYGPSVCRPLDKWDLITTIKLGFMKNNIYE